MCGSMLELIIYKLTSLWFTLVTLGVKRYVGRKHVSSMMDTCKEIGWFVSQTEHKGLKGAVAPRDFNTVLWYAHKGLKGAVAPRDFNTILWYTVWGGGCAGRVLYFLSL